VCVVFFGEGVLNGIAWWTCDALRQAVVGELHLALTRSEHIQSQTALQLDQDGVERQHAVRG
jgi:hypothetical protein